MLLAKYDGKRFAVSFLLGGQHRSVKGTARYERDAVLGANLAIRIEETDGRNSGGAVLHLQEGEWEGKISAGDSFECDYCIEIAPASATGPGAA